MSGGVDPMLYIAFGFSLSFWLIIITIFYYCGFCSNEIPDDASSVSTVKFEEVLEV